MSVQQIPLVVAWIAAIDPTREIDQIGLADRMTRELADASELGITEYYIGYFEQMPTFFMVGSPVEGKLPALPALPAGGVDYEIATLLVSPLIEEKLHLPLYHQVLQFIFKKELVERVIYQVEAKNDARKSALEAIGFRDLRTADSAPNRIWYGCRRTEFLMT
jgi:hypothetical protein